MIRELEKSIITLNEVHKKFSQEFYQENNFDYNLRRMDVKLAFNERVFSLKFLNYIEAYITKLSDYTAVNDQLDSISALNLGDFRTRIKQKDSVLNKLVAYRDQKEKVNGGLIMQKCLNDLFGARLVISDFDYNDKKMLQCVKRLSDDLPLMRFYFRNKEGYKGLHIYFKNKNNHYFPWELQLWNADDEKNNEFAHKKHKSKRAYISWPQKYQESQTLILRRKA